VSARALRLTLAAALLGGAVACASSGPPPAVPEPPTAEELFRDGLEILEGRDFGFWTYVNYPKAIDAFQEVIDNYPYSDYAVRAELQIADAYFAAERYQEALSYYRDFPELHPNHDRVPYTMLQAALAHYEQVRAPERDQGPTREALAVLDELMNKFPYSPEAERAETLWRELRTRLGESVMSVADFYMERAEFQAAVDRYRSVLNEFPGLGLDAEALYKLGVCYKKMNLEDEAERLFQVILDNYQDTEVADAAAGFIPAAN